MITLRKMKKHKKTQSSRYVDVLSSYFKYTLFPLAYFFEDVKRSNEPERVCCTRYLMAFFLALTIVAVTSLERYCVNAKIFIKPNGEFIESAHLLTSWVGVVFSIRQPIILIVCMVFVSRVMKSLVLVIDQGKCYIPESKRLFIINSVFALVLFRAVGTCFLFLFISGKLTFRSTIFILLMFVERIIISSYPTFFCLINIGQRYYIEGFLNDSLESSLDLLDTFEPQFTNKMYRDCRNNRDAFIGSGKRDTTSFKYVLICLVEGLSPRNFYKRMKSEDYGIKSLLSTKSKDCSINSKQVILELEINEQDWQQTVKKRIELYNMLSKQFHRIQTMLYNFDNDLQVFRKVVPQIVSFSLFGDSALLVGIALVYIEKQSLEMFVAMFSSCISFSLWLTFCCVSLNQVNTIVESTMNKFFDLIVVASKKTNLDVVTEKIETSDKDIISRTSDKSSWNYREASELAEQEEYYLDLVWHQFEFSRKFASTVCSPFRWGVSFDRQNMLLILVHVSSVLFLIFEMIILYDGKKYEQP